MLFTLGLFASTALYAQDVQREAFDEDVSTLMNTMLDAHKRVIAAEEFPDTLSFSYNPSSLSLPITPNAIDFALTRYPQLSTYSLRASVRIGKESYHNFVVSVDDHDNDTLFTKSVDAARILFSETASPSMPFSNSDFVDSAKHVYYSKQSKQLYYEGSFNFYEFASFQRPRPLHKENKERDQDARKAFAPFLSQLKSYLSTEFVSEKN